MKKDKKYGHKSAYRWDLGSFPGARDIYTRR